MSTAIVSQAHPMAAHQARRAVVKVAAGLIVVASPFAVYQGAQAVGAHFAQQPTSTVSYASHAAIARTLAGAWHTAARAGDFIDAASIQTPDVVSVVKAVN